MIPREESIHPAQSDHLLEVCEYSKPSNIEVNNTIFDLASNRMALLENLEYEVFRSSKTLTSSHFNKLECMKLCLVENKECPSKTHEKYLLCNEFTASLVPDVSYSEGLQSTTAYIR